jgi:DUF1680 family protein
MRAKTTAKLLSVACVTFALATQAFAEPPAPKIPRVAEPFPLSEVRLLDGPFRDAQLRNEKYLLALEPDRFLQTFRANVNLPTTAKPYGGWEKPDTEIRGHAFGHYLSALSLTYASTGDERFKQRVDYIVAELAKCQSNSPAAGFHAGYLSAFPESFIDRVENGRPVWVPWYTEHKIMAGLLDANQLCGNAQALDVLTKMADWVKFRVDRISHEQMQKSLDTEQGGMNEVLANLYGVTGEKKYLELSAAFNHARVLDPLSRGEDRLNGIHANTQIPKIVGAAREYEFTGDEKFLNIAKTFWDSVALRRSFAIGGHSDHEHFFPTNEFALHVGTDTAETCNTYNMLKLTRELFALEPEAAKMDFYERGLYNHILASQDPETGMFVYLMSLKPGHFKTYSTPEDSFWCCVGTGMENHSKYADTIYFHDANYLYVNLFIASELSWPEKGLTLRQETKFPESDTTVLKFKVSKPTSIALKIRHPAWAENGMEVLVNNQMEKLGPQSGNYFILRREWHDGDEVKIQLPMKLHTEFLPGTTNEIALLYGPIVLAGELGTKDMPDRPLAHNQTDFNTVPDPSVPVFVGDAAGLLAQVERVPGDATKFRTHGLARPDDVTLIPFYQMHRQRYSVYWKLLSEDAWANQKAELAVAEARRIAEEARTVDVVRPGEQQSETDHKLAGEKTETGEFIGRKWRHAGNWFSYEMKVAADAPQELAVTFWGSDAGSREFDILVDEKILATQKLDNNRPEVFYDAVFPLPAALLKDKQTITVKFSAHPASLAGGVYGVRVMRSAEGDSVRIGDAQSESAHKMQGEESASGEFSGRGWRHSAKWFSYEMKVQPGQPQQLVATFWGGDAGAREFDILVDGKIVGTQKLDNNKPGEFFDVMFPLSADMTKDKKNITVKFAAHPGNSAGGLFGLRVEKSK